jgi:mannose-6-phosphate isomerase-like protein (cupin superfamily)
MDVEVGAFFSPERSNGPVTRQAERRLYTVLHGTIIREPPGFRSEPMAHEGEEMFYVVCGEVTLEIDGERVVLRAGDTAHFQSTRTHSTWNHTTESATILHVCTMDVFGEGSRSLGIDENPLAARIPARRIEKRQSLNSMGKKG